MHYAWIYYNHAYIVFAYAFMHTMLLEDVFMHTMVTQSDKKGLIAFPIM